MVGSDHVVQDRQTIALPGLIQPLQIPMPILRKFEKEFSLMATVCDMPDVPWNEMSFCSRHMHSKKNELFTSEKLNIDPF